MEGGRKVGRVARDMENGGREEGWGKINDK